MPEEVLYVKFEITGVDGKYYLSMDDEKAREFKSYTGALIYMVGLTTHMLSDAIVDPGERVWGADESQNG